MSIKTRQPTGRAPWPLVLVEGPEKSGKSWCCAELSASEKVGQTYWMDLAEGAADEYGAIDGARYLVVDHDGTWADIVAQVAEIKAEAQRAADAGEPPVVLVVDSMTAEWDMLKAWAGDRAKRSKANQAKLAKDPSAEVSVSMNLWNDATSRHRRLMTMLLTFPGIVVITARGKEVASLDDNGRPIEGSKEYKVESHKTLPYDASVWVRMSREQAPVVVGARSVHHGVRPGVDKPKPAPSFTLEWLVFDVLKAGDTGTSVRDMPTLDADQVMPGEEPPSEDEPTPPRPPRGRPQASVEEIARMAEATVTKLLVVDSREKAGELWREANNSAAKDTDVSGLLTAFDREVVGVEEKQPVTLVALAEMVGAYVVKHGKAVQQASEPEPQAEVAAA